MLLTALRFFLLVLFVCSYSSAYENHYVDEVAQHYFQDDKALEVAPLTGGYSDAQNFLLRSGNKKYVLRIQKLGEDFSNEIYTMQQAAKLKIAPEILYVTQDRQAVLMEFVEGCTLSASQAHDSQSSAQIAQGIGVIHLIPRNPSNTHLSFFDAVKKVYEEMQKQNQFATERNEMMQEFIKTNLKLAQMDAPRVTTHGDLNPRNIFIGAHGVRFIDWSESKWEDPFQDIAYFALLNDYAQNEELHFLSTYLKRPPTLAERVRYQLIKKEILLYFGLGMLKSVTSELTVRKQQPLKNWSYYVSILFSPTPGTELNDQFLYEMSRRAFLDAKSVVIPAEDRIDRCQAASEYTPPTHAHQANLIAHCLSN